MIAYMKASNVPQPEPGPLRVEIVNASELQKDTVVTVRRDESGKAHKRNGSQGVSAQDLRRLMSDVFSDADHELEVQLQILQERDATLNHEITELLTSPRMMTILGRQRTQKALRWFQNLKARYHHPRAKFTDPQRSPSAHSPRKARSNKRRVPQSYMRKFYLDSTKRPHRRVGMSAEIVFRIVSLPPTQTRQNDPILAGKF